MGMLGAGFASAALGRGESVVVWNRSADKVAPLVAKGARAAASPADAVRGASRVHMILSDDAAVDATLLQAEPALERGAVIVDHTTCSPEGTARRIAAQALRGRSLLHAPVFMSPQMAHDAKGLILTSGPGWLFSMVRPHLEKMTGEVLYLGERSDLAAGFKLFGNAMIFAVMGGITDVFAMARAMGVQPEHALTLFQKFSPARTIDVRGVKMAKGEFAPSFAATMARKDARLMMELAASGGQSVPVVASVAAALDRAIARGRGEEDCGVIAEELVAPLSEEAARVLMQLSRCHMRTNEMLAGVESGDTTLTDLVMFFDRNVARHEKDEEESVMPRLPAAQKELRDQIAAEHRQHEALINQLGALGERAGRGEDVSKDLARVTQELKYVYHAHMALEDAVLFPAAARGIDPETWKAIAGEVDARRGRTGGGGGGGGGGGRGGGRGRGQG
jgi:3-hydroxyisobutyrate dehydrogenase